MGTISWGGGLQLTEEARGSVSIEHIQTHWETARDYSIALYQAARELMESVNYPLEINAVPTYELQLQQSGITGALPTAPNIADIAIPDVNFNGVVPSFTPPDITISEPPQFTTAEPTFSLPDPPDVDFPVLTSTPPAISDIALPTAPTYVLPDVPTITQVAIPAPPEYNLPDFEGTFPTADLTPPDNTFVYVEPEYSSELAAQLQAKLSSDLTTGGSGLPEATEQAIYDRAVSRQQEEFDKAQTDIFNLFAARGFPLPPGALAGQMVELSARITQVREDLNNDILIQQSKLAQENTWHTIDKSIEYERDMVAHFNSVMTRALDAAKTSAMMAVEIFNARVEAYKGQLSAYQVMASVYETRIRAEVAKADLYRAQIEGAKAQVEVQMLYLEAYKSQIAGIQALIQMYATQMEAARIEADINRTQIQAYGALIEAYKAQVQAVTARYDAYAAQIRGEEARANMYKAQVDAYSARVAAYKAEADVDVSRAQVQVEYLKGQTDVFQSQIAEFQARVQAAVAQADVNVRVQTMDIETYKADISRYNAEMEARVGEMNAIVREIQANLDLEGKIFEAIQRFNQSVMETNSENNRVAARVAGQQAAAYISTHSTSITAGHRESRGDSRSDSDSLSSSNVSSDSHSVSYNHIITEGS